MRRARFRRIVEESVGTDAQGNIFKDQTFVTRMSKEAFEEFLANIWYAKRRWSSSTFKLLEDDTWLALSSDRNVLTPVHDWTDSNHKWLHLVRIHNGTDKYPQGVMYPKRASQEDQKELIRVLVKKVAQSDIDSWYSFYKKKPLKF